MLYRLLCNVFPIDMTRAARNILAVSGRSRLRSVPSRRRSPLTARRADPACGAPVGSKARPSHRRVTQWSARRRTRWARDDRPPRSKRPEVRLACRTAPPGDHTGPLRQRTRSVPPHPCRSIRGGYAMTSSRVFSVGAMAGFLLGLIWAAVAPPAPAAWVNSTATQFTVGGQLGLTITPTANTTVDGPSVDPSCGSGTQGGTSMAIVQSSKLANVDADHLATVPPVLLVASCLSNTQTT